MARKLHPRPKIVGVKRKDFIIVLSVDENNFLPNIEYYVKL